jgi:hypothetical protein
MSDLIDNLTTIRMHANLSVVPKIGKERIIRVPKQE